MLPIDQLTKPVSKAQAKATIYTMLGKAGLPVTSWQSGAALRALVWVLATLVAGSSELLAAIVKGLFLGSATGVWLTLLARYVYGITRRGATFAAVELTINNAKGGVYPFEARECIALDPVTKQTYVNIAPFTITALVSGLKVGFQAVEAGAASTSGVGAISQLVTTLLGVSVTNAAAAIGADEQGDEELRQDCYDAIGALSPFGAAGAYKYFAKHLPGGDPLVRADGTAIEVNRTQVVTNPDTGVVTVWVASSSGAITGDKDTPGDDLYIIDQNLRLNAVPQCITETTAAAIETNVSVWYTLYVDAETAKTEAEIEADVAAALTVFGATYPIAGQRLVDGGQGYLFLNRLRQVILDAVAGSLSVTMLGPVADTDLDEGEFANLAPALASSVVLVNQQ